jgi:hypothetical protein
MVVMQVGKWVIMADVIPNLKRITQPVVHKNRLVKQTRLYENTLVTTVSLVWAEEPQTLPRIMAVVVAEVGLVVVEALIEYQEQEDQDMRSMNLLTNRKTFF